MIFFPRWGLYRFLLAESVVFFHVGGGHWPVGRAAVFCFYFVSGFVISRVLDRNYWGSAKGIAAFYANRALRLLPLYAAISLITVAVVSLHGSTIFTRSDGDPVHPFGSSLPLTISGLLPLPTYQNLMLTGTASAIPQGWSIGVEICFYLVAPLLVIIGRRKKLGLVALAALLMLGLSVVAIEAPDLAFLDNYVHQNALTSFAMFACGAAAYFLFASTEFRMSLPAAAGIVALFAFALYDFGLSEMTNGGLLLVILLAIPASAAICFVELPKAFRRWDQAIGDLSYGTYLNHFLIAILMLWLGETLQWHPFGRFGSPGFSWWAFALCAAAALAGFKLLERPLQRLKLGQRREKAASSGEAVPTAATSPVSAPAPSVVVAAAE